MRKEIVNSINDLNKGIIKCRNVYSLWANMQGISYGEMLVFYMIREYGYANQKEICDSYKVAKQTINNIISRMRENNILAIDDKNSNGNLKRYVLTDSGKAYASSFFDSLDKFEDCAVKQIGEDKLNELNRLLKEYDEALNDALRK